MGTQAKSRRAQQREWVNELRARHRAWAEIAVLFRRRYQVNARVAMRMVHGWSQGEAAERWCVRWPADPKTFKNFSYWEQWPSATGHAPTLHVLSCMAELYQCRVADLLDDAADFRNLDESFLVARQLRGLPPIRSESDRPVVADREAGEASNDGWELLQRLEAIDVREVATLAAAWSDQSRGPDLNRRALLLKLSAGLSLAAAMPASSGADNSLPQTDSITASAAMEDLSGVWHSQYVYHSSGRDESMKGEHYVVLRPNGRRLVGQSLPHTSGSRLSLELTTHGAVATGTWREQTSTAGYYKGAIYHGTLQLIVEPHCKRMVGKWLGFGKDFTVNSGDWELNWTEDATGHSARRKYHHAL